MANDLVLEFIDPEPDSAGDGANEEGPLIIDVVIPGSVPNEAPPLAEAAPQVVGGNAEAAAEGEKTPPPPTAYELKIAEKERLALEAEEARVAAILAERESAAAAEEERLAAIAQAEAEAEAAVLADMVARREVAQIAGYAVKAGKRAGESGYWLHRPDKTKAFFRSESRAWRAAPDYRYDATAAARDLVGNRYNFTYSNGVWYGWIDQNYDGPYVEAETMAGCFCEMAIKHNERKDTA